MQQLFSGFPFLFFSDLADLFLAYQAGVGVKEFHDQEPASVFALYWGE
jgi:hypothetical protein